MTIHRIAGRAIASSRLAWRGRRAAVWLMFALTAVPIVGFVGLAIDYATWSQAYASMYLAANGAALNAAKIAASAQIAGNKNYISDGVTAGTQWFTAQVGANAYGASLVAASSTVAVTNPTTTTITATVTFSAQVKSVFGGLFSVARYPVGMTTAATISTAPYLQVTLLLDNSASMLIGASATDMAAMMQLSPCAPSEVAQDINTNPLPPNAAWPEFRCELNSWSYTLTSCPIPVSSPWTISQLTPLADGVETPWYGPSCQGQPGIKKNADGSWPYAAAPCAFACHSDGTKPAGSGNDLLGIARGTIGTANPVTLRLDVVKNAVNTLVASMKSESLPSNNLSIGIWDFNITLNRDYPASGEAGTDFTAAAAAVGSAPKVANGAETGITPDLQVSGSAQPDTYWDDAGAQLASTLTAAGDGTTAATPRKVLFIIGDGLTDQRVNGTRVIQGYNTDVCATFKNMGYTVYVVFTPYYPLAERDYVTKFDLPALVEPTDTSANATNLQNCASGPSQYLQATDEAGLTSALNTFFQQAVANSVARYTQ